MVYLLLDLELVAPCQPYHTWAAIASHPLLMLSRNLK
jgi:hypothetical protein